MYDSSCAYYLSVLMTIHKSDTKHKIKYTHYIVLQNIIFPPVFNDSGHYAAL